MAWLFKTTRDANFGTSENFLHTNTGCSIWNNTKIQGLDSIIRSRFLENYFSPFIKNKVRLLYHCRVKNAPFQCYSHLHLTHLTLFTKVFFFHCGWKCCKTLSKWFNWRIGSTLVTVSKLKNSSVTQILCQIQNGKKCNFEFQRL